MGATQPVSRRPDHRIATKWFAPAGTPVQTGEGTAPDCPDCLTRSANARTGKKTMASRADPSGWIVVPMGIMFQWLSSARDCCNPLFHCWTCAVRLRKGA